MDNAMPLDKDPTKNIPYIEAEVARKIWPEIKDYVHYLQKVYTFCFAIRAKLNNVNLNSINNSLMAQMHILMKITDSLRCIELVAEKGYPRQTSELAASIFEKAHTLICFSYDLDGRDKWLDSDGMHQMPGLIKKGLKWKQLVNQNKEKIPSLPWIFDYKVYENLCCMKHALPSLNNRLTKVNQNQTQPGIKDK